MDRVINHVLRPLRCVRDVGVAGSNPVTPTIDLGSILVTWVTDYSGHMGNTLALLLAIHPLTGAAPSNTSAQRDLDCRLRNYVRKGIRQCRNSRRAIGFSR